MTKDIDHSNITIRPYDKTTDLSSVWALWQKTLPGYPIANDHLGTILDLEYGSHAAHSVAIVSEDRMAGFCASYASEVDNSKASMPLIMVDPEYQGHGCGKKLVQSLIASLSKDIKTIDVGITTPRFWPGAPIGLGEGLQEFYKKLGFKETSSQSDLYQSTSNFTPPSYLIDRARSNGITFAPLTSSGFDECIAAQDANFWWGAFFRFLHEEGNDDEVMVAFDRDGKQVGWTMMLTPGKSKSWSSFAFFPIVGGEDGISGQGRVGLICCVGVDPEARKLGVGLAMCCAAMEEMKRRGGIDDVFVDWVKPELVGWYGKIGFRVWSEYKGFKLEIKH